MIIIERVTDNVVQVGRATTQVMMKTGQVEKTSDRQYEVEERRYRTLESASLRLQKEAKGYLDSLRAMTASQMRIAETIDAFYGDSGATDGVSRSYKQAVEDLDAETVKALDGPYRFVPSDLRGFAWDWEKGVEDTQELRAIEWEMNRGVQESFAGVMKADMDSYGELMDFIYRTTVLEPINRFCAYFPDINECRPRIPRSFEVGQLLMSNAGIKKRQHKMLDYDAMRGKVKRLTEKPDKDPAKLPRTEKEQDMVSLSDFLRDSPPSGTTSLQHKRESSWSAFGINTNLDFALPSPPKALNGIRQRLGLAPDYGDDDVTGITNENAELVSFPSRGRRSRMSILGRTSSIISNYSTLLSPKLDSGTEEKGWQRAEKRQSISSTLKARSIAPEPETPTPKRSISFAKRDQRVYRSSSIYSKGDQMVSRSSSIYSTRTAASNMAPSTRDSASTRGGTWPRNRRLSSLHRTPFFEPSELEEIMEPLREDFVRRQADDLQQAKVAYDQLNDQLMSELPQLIDLR